jgi:hypothetical protein
MNPSREATDLAALRWQRDAAVATAALTVSIAAALLLANFAGSSAGLETTRRAIAEHQRLFEISTKDRRTNEQALQENRAALEKLKKTVIATP